MPCHCCCLAQSGDCTSAAAGRLPLSLRCCPCPAHCRRAEAALPCCCLPRRACSDAAGGRRPVRLWRHLPGFSALQIAPRGLRQSVHQGTSPLQDRPGCLHQAGLLEQLAPCRQAQSQHRRIGCCTAFNWRTLHCPGHQAPMPQTQHFQQQLSDGAADGNLHRDRRRCPSEKQNSAQGLPTRCWGTDILCLLHT